MEKINALWFRFRNWGETGFLGAIVLGATKVVFSIMIATLVLLAVISTGFFDDTYEEDDLVEDMRSDISEESCTVQGITLRGSLLSYVPSHAENDYDFDYDVVSSEDVIWYVKDANERENIKAILIEVDSYGGSPTAGEEIAQYIKDNPKPVIARIRMAGASAAYWAISSADKIFVSRNSDVGSIGVTSSYLSNVKKNEEEGYKFESISVGKFKDSGSPDKPLTEEERALFQKDVEMVYNNFIEDVSKNRNLSLDAVKNIATGATVLGEQAKALGLVDEIGGVVEVEKYLEEITGSKPIICW